MANQSAARTEKENWVSGERKVVGAPGGRERGREIERERKSERERGKIQITLERSEGKKDA